MKVVVTFFLIALCSSFSSSYGQNLTKFSDIKPGMRDKWIEREAVRLANKRGMNYNWHERYLKAVIISSDWEPYGTRDGCLKGRKIHLELYAEMPGGKCFMADFIFKEKLREDGTLSEFM